MSEQVEEHVIKRFELVKKVGSGAYGHVWKAINRKTKAVVALKKIFDAFQHSTDAQRTFREITLLNQMNHPNIIKLHTVIRAENDKDIYLVFEFMQADLHNVIGQRILQDIHTRYVVYQLAKALKYLHSAELIHRDLKPSNILVNSDCNIKVCDFGLVRCLAADKDGDNVILTEEVATRWYRAPEVLLGSKTYDKAADMWSMGCILAEMLLLKPIFPGNSTLNQLERILTFTGKPSTEDVASLDSELATAMIDSIKSVKFKSIRQWFNPTIPNDAVDLVSKLLQFNPKKRPTAVQVLNHPFLSQFHNPSEQVVSPTVIRPPISDNKKLSLKQYRNLLYEQIKRLYNRDSQQLTATAPLAFNQTRDIVSPKRRQQLEPTNKDANVVNKSTHSVHSTSKKKQQVRYTATVKGVDYQAQIRTLLEEEAMRAHKKSSGYLPKRRDDGFDGYLHSRQSMQSPSYIGKFREYPVIKVDKENKR